MSSKESVEAAEKPRRSVWAVIRSILTEVVVVVVAAVILSVLWRTFVAQMFIIPSGSMENTLQVDDRVLVAKFGGFQRGDVVVFEDPGDWLTTPPPPPDAFRETLEFIGVFPSSSSEHLIKRVIGMPGDHVSFGESGKITVNGHELDERAYLYASDGVQIPPATVPFDVVVPAGHIFVMGDHRNHSADSRCRLTRESESGPPGSVAFVPVDKVVGASVAILAPLPRLSTFIVPETFADVPDPTEPAPSEAVINLAEPGC
ncbi:MAG: signal peptidase I [Propionibacterium sp.]|nr:MAG: signal peptidase I [Propionibacterium sp.]